MMRYFLSPFLTILVLSTGIVHANDKTSGDLMNSTENNPLFTPSTLPFHAPPFDKIKDSDYQPALEKGMQEQIKEIESIAENPAAPTFENTFIPLEKSGQLLGRASAAFNAVTGANTDSVLQRVQEEEAPKLAAHYDAIYLNAKLFQRIKTIYDTREQRDLDPESGKLVEYYYRKFVHAGANLSAEDQSKLKALNEEEATLGAQFTNKLLAATKNAALVVRDSVKLAGLSTDEKAEAAQRATDRGLDDQWIIALQNTTRQPDMRYLKDREVRKQLFEHSWNRTEQNDENDTRTIIQRLAKVRAEKAALLGFKNYAVWKLEDQMAKTPEAVRTFLDNLIPATVANEQKEAEALQTFIRNTGSDITLRPWDWNYYAEMLRKEKYDYDESQVRPYFLLENVLKKGIFYAASQLYGITFTEVHNIPTYQKDVRVFKVFDSDGSPLALFYADFFARDNKSGGAWMDNLVVQSKLLGQKPVIYNVTNITKPAPGKPALLSFSEVRTMFHEFGHALHGMFADQNYPSLSGTDVPRDFVEFPSQFNEHWALYPDVLQNYARHYKTGAPLPQELVDKIKCTATFNQGYDFTELLEAADLDLAWHTLSPDKPEQDPDSFEISSLKADSLYFSEVPPRYRSSYFAHIWGGGGGYAAGYYAYLWSEMLDDDAYEWFLENGGLTRENGDKFRKTILSRGATGDYGTMYRNLTGHDPRIEPMLKDRGLQ